MNATTLQEVFRASFSNYSATRRLPLKHLKAAEAIMSCRTEVQGGHVQRCPKGHESKIQYHSCRHRSCPLCSAFPKEQWLRNQMNRLLPIRHFHLVFTLPHELHAIWRFNQRWLTHNLFQVTADTLLTLSKDSRYLGATPGLLMNIHTWGRNLSLHPHIHCLMTGGGLTQDGNWRETRHSFLFPAGVVRAIYRGKFLARLNDGIRTGQIRLPDDMTEYEFRRTLARLSKKNWHVKIQPPYSHGNGVMKYLARYVKGGPIQNHRIKSDSLGQIRFEYRDHRDRGSKSMSLNVLHFIGRVLEHVSESKQHTVRSYGLYGHQAKGKRAICRDLLELEPEQENQPMDCFEYLENNNQSAHTKCRVCGRRLVRGTRLIKNSIIKTSGSGHVQQDVEDGIDPRLRSSGRPPDNFGQRKNFPRSMPLN